METNLNKRVIGQDNALKLLSEAILKFSKVPNIIVKIDTIEERKNMRDLPELEFVDANYEISNLLVARACRSDV